MPGLTAITKVLLEVPAELVAVTVMEYAPAVPAAGVPAMVAVPLLPGVKVTPVGSVPVLVRVGSGYPVADRARE